MKYLSNSGPVLSDQVRTTRKIANEGCQHPAGHIPFEAAETWNVGAESRTKQRVSVVGQNISRPMDRVEFDEWQADVMALLGQEGPLDHPNHQGNEKSRYWVTAAMCRTTRFIAAVEISRTPKAPDALRALEEVVRDNGNWGNACDDPTPPIQLG